MVDKNENERELSLGELDRRRARGEQVVPDQRPFGRAGREESEWLKSGDVYDASAKGYVHGGTNVPVKYKVVSVHEDVHGEWYVVEETEGPNVGDTAIVNRDGRLSRVNLTPRPVVVPEPEQLGPQSQVNPEQPFVSSDAHNANEGLPGYKAAEPKAERAKPGPKPGRQAARGVQVETGPKADEVS